MLFIVVSLVAGVFGFWVVPGRRQVCAVEALAALGVDTCYDHQFAVVPQFTHGLTPSLLPGIWLGHLTTGAAPLLMVAQVVATENHVGQAAEQSARVDPSVPVLERLVSLRAVNMPLRQALAELCRQVGVELMVDDAAKAESDLDLDRKVSLAVEDVPLSEALVQILIWKPSSGFIREVRGGKLWLTALAVVDEAVREFAGQRQCWFLF
jgi:hypothetical protein